MNTPQFLASHYSSEDQMTMLCYYWIKDNFPALRGRFFHVPNELPMAKGEGSKEYARRLSKRSAMGVTAGIPDFICVNPFFAVELKMKNGSLSPAQKEIHADWKQFMPLYICRSLLEFHNIIIKHVNNANNGSIL